MLLQVPQLVQNPGVDVSELQLVPPNELAGQEAAVLSRNGNNNRSQSLSLLNTGTVEPPVARTHAGTHAQAHTHAWTNTDRTGHCHTPKYAHLQM